MSIHQQYIGGSVVVLLLAFGAVIAFGGQKDSSDVAGQQEEAVVACRDFSERALRVGDKNISVAMADSREEHAQGLSGCEAVPSNSGMYFQFEQAGKPTFWMKDMVIPIDIIWIKEGKIVGINPNVPPQPGAPNESLLRYRAPEEVDAVLEVGAGQAEALGLVEGQAVAF